MKLTLALTCLLLVGIAGAQTPQSVIGVYGDLSAQSRSIELAPGEIRDLYVLALDAGPMSGWEAHVTIDNTGWTFLGSYFNPPDALVIGTNRNYVVGLGGCFSGDPIYWLVRYQFAWLSAAPIPSDTFVCVIGGIPSSFGGFPGYATCDEEVIAAQLPPAIGELRAGCLVLNPLETIQTDAASWGGVKARF